MDTRLLGQRIVLAFNGNTASCAAVRWLTATRRAEVAALIVDVGQANDLEEVRARALTCGAVRGHVVDPCEVFARQRIVPAAAAAAPIDDQALRRLAHPVIAAALVEVAAMERADAVAYASLDGSLGDEVRALDPALRILATSPALGVLRAAYRASGGRGSAALQLQPGSLTSIDERTASPALVNHA